MDPLLCSDLKCMLPMLNMKVGPKTHYFKQGSESAGGAFVFCSELGSRGNCVPRSFSQLLLTSLVINGARTRMKGRMP